MKYWRWLPLTCRKIRKFARWREFQCLAAPPWSFSFTTWLVETVLPFRPSKSILGRGVEAEEMLTEIPGQKHHVLLYSSGSCRSFAISARQFVETYLLNILVRAWCLGKFVWHEKFVGQGRSWNLKFRNFHEILTLVAFHVLKNTQIRSLTRISMPCGVAVVISHHTWLVETVQTIRPSKFLLGRGVEAEKMLTEISGKQITFLLPARNPDNRLRYPPVSL